MEFKLPDLGENIDSGDVISVLVKEGDEVQANQGLMEIETGKAVVEVPSPQAGRIGKIHVKKGDKVPVGAPLVTIEAAQGAGEKQSEKPSEKATEKPAEKPAEKPSEKKPAQRAAAEQPSRPKAEERPPERAAERPAPQRSEQRPQRSEQRPQPAAATSESDDGGGNGVSTEPAPAAPATRRLARELGVDLGRVRGSGPGGRITREDVMAAVRELNQLHPPAEIPPPLSSPGRERAPLPEGVEDQDAHGHIRRVPLTRIRKAIAANMARSHSTIPHVTNFDDADVTELERIRKSSVADYDAAGVKLTMMPFLLKAVAHALRLHPAVNVSLDMEREEAVYKEYVNLGVAVDTERGLVVPVLRSVDRLSIRQIAEGLAAIADKARANQTALDEMRGGTFTISNLGAIGGTYSTPIINFPEVAILLVGRSRKLPVVVDDEVTVRLMCPLSLSYDHRWVDGATAARFLNEVKGFLESPTRLLLAP